MSKQLALFLLLSLNMLIAVAQSKTVPAGFPVDCPALPKETGNLKNHTQARISSDSLWFRGRTLLSQVNKENFTRAIDLFEQAVAVDSSNAELYYTLSAAYAAAPRFAGMDKKTGDDKSLSYFLKGYATNPNSITGLRAMELGFVAYPFKK